MKGSKLRLAVPIERVTNEDEVNGSLNESFAFLSAGGAKIPLLGLDIDAPERREYLRNYPRLVTR